MADTVTTTYTGRLIIPLQSGNEKTTRAITIEDPVQDVASINAALADTSDWLRNSTVEAVKWAIQPSTWRDYDPTAILNGNSGASNVTWSLSAEDPLIFEITDKTVSKYSENYGVQIFEPEEG